MRFVIRDSHIEYWKRTGKVVRYANTPANQAVVAGLVTYYRLMEQHFSDRIVYTHYFI